jgi:hypothetical protein
MVSCLVMLTCGIVSLLFQSLQPHPPVAAVGGTVTVMARDAERAPLPGVAVTVRTPVAAAPQNVGVTDADGRVEYRPQQTGTFVFEAMLGVVSPGGTASTRLETGDRPGREDDGVRLVASMSVREAQRGLSMVPWILAGAVLLVFNLARRRGVDG